MLSDLDVLGAWAFLPAGFRERDFLPFTKIVIGNAFKTGRVKEQVFVSAHVDESETFVSESFDSTFSHLF